MHDLINQTASVLSIPVTDAPIHSGDAFYRTLEGLPAIVEKYQLPVVEMEAFALFANAKVLRKSAACLLTVSDNIITREVISADEREKSLDRMAILALTAASEW
jgi:purine-nucleoside phosphorylase